MFKRITKWKKERKLRNYRTLVGKVAELDLRARLTLTEMTDEMLKERFLELKDRVAVGNDLADVLPDVFAHVREAALRTLGIRAYDVQIMGALALCNGAVAEMATGEGKTLTAAFAAFVQFLQDKQVHIHTANEYLADRDATALLKLYRLMGMNVGVARLEQTREEKQLVYSCDVVYGTHAVFAMDYLADHLARHPNEVVQVRGLGFALVDEADSLLIDEARVPVVLTAARPADVSLFQTLAGLAKTLTRAADVRGEGHFFVDGKDRQVVLTEAGYDAVNAALIEAGLLSADESKHYAFEHQQLLQKMTVTLGAHNLLHRDQHYIVQDGAIVLVDELTGRLVPNRSWDGGMQQALEAKEGLQLSPESQVLGRITLQHFFKLYEGLAGMTGTAATEAEELMAVYGLDVIQIPTNKPRVRIDESDRFYRTQAAKMDAVVADIEARHAKGQPVLVGTASIEQSEQLSAVLSAKGLVHEVLNAREHAREADVIAQAGAPGAITVSTNMSGRGVDIILGGNPDGELRRRWYAMGADAWNALTGAEQKAIVDEIRGHCAIAADTVRNAGGLHIIGMERYESRRMDLQLRGRAGRQGDPGSTCFYISFEDPLVENFAGEQIRGILAQLDVKPGDELESKLVKKSIDSAQRQVEGRAADGRKQLIAYDEVVNKQRAVMYAQRDDILRSDDLHGWIVQLRDEQAELLVARYAADAIPEGWDLAGLRRALLDYGVELPSTDAQLRELEDDELLALVKAALAEQHAIAAAQVPAENLNNAERYVVLLMLDHNWFAHLDDLAELRRGINLRVHAKQDPQQEYKKDAFKAFEALLDDIKVGMVTRALTWRLSQSEEPESVA
jgi:preprotein translocase subunit SecA